MASIQPLAPGVAEQLRASVIINSLEQCATELVQNSLDANATSIEVRVDIAAHNLQVSDNGDGVTSVDMGRIGTRYATSKCSNLRDLMRITTFGFRGEAIAALAEMSWLNIVSRPQNQEHVHSAVFEGGERIYCDRSSESLRFGHGTTVSVRNLFYKYPVRQRKWTNASANKIDQELERVKRAVEIMALIAPRVSFTVIDMAKDTKVMTCRKVDEQIHRITAVLGQSLAASLTRVSSNPEESIYRLSGFISKVGHYNRVYQFIYLNGRPIKCEGIQKSIGRLFQQSSFSKDSRTAEGDARSKERYPVFVLMLKCPANTYDMCVDPSKLTIQFVDEKRVLQLVRDTIISFLEQHDFLSESSATMLRYQTTTRKRKAKDKSIPDQPMEDISVDQLPHVKVSRPSRTARPHSTAPSPESRLDESNGHRSSSEMDVADEVEYELDAEWMARWLDDEFVADELGYSSQGESSGTSSDLSREPSNTTRISLPHACSSQNKPRNTETSGIWALDALRKWVNPVFSGASSQIPSLQSLSLHTPTVPEPRELSKSIRETFSEVASNQLNSLITQLSALGAKENYDVVIMELLKSSLPHARVLGQTYSKYVMCIMDWSSLSATLPGQPKITALVAVEQHAADERVRVERLMKEMCVCSYEKTNAPTSSFNDPDNEPEESVKHRVDSKLVTPPVLITLSRLEWNTARLYSDWLYRWGIVLSASPGYKNPSHARGTGNGHQGDTTVSRHFMESLSDSDEEVGMSGTRFDHGKGHATSRAESPANGCVAESEYVQCWVTSLPRVVAARCEAEEDLTLNLIKDTISFAEEIQYGECPVTPGMMGISDEATSGLQCLRGCPRKLLSIVNSNACRGAIMDNEELSLEQCKELVRNLAQCNVPLGCAHLRWSMAVLSIFTQSPTLKPRRRQRERRSGEDQESSTGKTRKRTRWESWMRDTME